MLMLNVNFEAMEKKLRIILERARDGVEPLEDLEQELLNLHSVKHSHICFCMYTAYDCDVKNHPQKVMKELGITYQHATPQSISDEWWFWNCENIPKELPHYLDLKNWNPMEMIGHGLSKKEAEAIRDYA